MLSRFVGEILIEAPSFQETSSFLKNFWLIALDKALDKALGCYLVIFFIPFSLKDKICKD